MKKILYRVAVIFLFFSLIPACDQLGDCKNCHKVTDDNGVVTYGNDILTCGSQLTDRENSDPVTIGNTTTYWECN